VAGFLDTQSGANQTEALYIAYFGRAGDGPGYLYWTNSLATMESHGAPASVAVVNVADAFAVQPEATAQYAFLASPPATLSTTDPTQIAGVDGFINQVYQHLFNRTADSAGLTYWQTQILSGAVSVGSAVYAIANGALGSDQGILADKIIAASTFTSQTFASNITSGSNFLAAAHVAVANVVDATTLAASQAGTTTFVNTATNPGLILTTGVDTITASTAGAVFNAPLISSSVTDGGTGIIVGGSNQNLQTLTVGDTLVDSANDGTLNAFLTATDNPGFAFIPAVTMSGIKTASLTNVSAGVGGFEGNITGLTVVNDNNSNGGIQVGAIGAGLKTALTNVNVNGFFAPAGGNGLGVLLFTGVIAQAAGSASNTINASLSGLLGATGLGQADKLTFETDGTPGTKASPNVSYGTWALTLNSPADLQLQQNGVGGATTLKISGPGNVALGEDVAGNWQKLTTIDASGSTGNVTITGAVAGLGSNAAATAANPGGLYGSGAGLLDGNMALTSFLLSGGTGVNILDVSSFTTTAQLAALTTTAGSNTATTNEIIVKSLLADTVTASPWANIKGFQIVGIDGAGGDTGTVNLANLPSSVTELLYQTTAVGGLTVNNLPTAFTVDTEANGNNTSLTIGAIGPAGGTADSLTLIVGSPTAVGQLTPVTVTGEEVVTVTTQGPAGGNDAIGFMSLTPTVTGNEHVTIGGTEAVTIGSGLGAIADINPGSTPAALFANNLTVNITDTHAVTLTAATAAGALLSADPVGDTPGSGPVNSINAITIDAHLSGGLTMLGGDANFTSSTTAGGSAGDTITGSATAGNLLGGSIGNDTIVGTTNTTASDTVYTAGGADAITLQAGHTAADHVELYGGNGIATAITPGVLVEGAQAHSIVTAGDIPQLGWWNHGTSATGGAASTATTNLGTALGFGTSADLSTVANFTPAHDVVDLSVGAFSGLLHDAFTGLLVAGGADATFSTPTGSGATVVPAVAGPGAASSVLVLNGTFTGAAGVASALAGAGAITFGAPVPVVSAAIGDHFIVAYQDTGSNSVHLADLDIHSAAPITTTAGGAGQTVAVSDLVQLTGVSVTALHASNVHFVA
jgi:hypothetical protein